MEGMDEQRFYRELVAWLRTNHPRVLAQWESERKYRESVKDGATPLLQASTSRPGSELDRLPPDAGTAEITSALRRELELLGITGGASGSTPDGTPCIHLTKEGVYGSAYEETVTLARLRDPGYRRHLRQAFG
jgi:hypothetical protein